ncbi:hypothetical protein [Falsiroseomonas tokyonensis]|uniref:Uncharacterized protein n=1 Tax=Falsiroseomonas tokyonensis TaxID=430521 RepID=A0ABV7BW15_9PROT|nr:hypothetical protein [Falsiroseomonas tokyonensis]MBU8539872.1 hypothetical protein [Falsiroseomonas tokyonensis]
MIRKLTLAFAAPLLGLSLAAPAHAVLSANGISHQGVTLNGLSYNGQLSIGLTFNGLTFNGRTFNRGAFNGQVSNGAEAEAPTQAIQGIILPSGTVLRLR